MTPTTRKWLAAAFLVPVLGIAIVVGAWWWYADGLRRAQAERARIAFEPAITALHEAADTDDVDIDKTVRVIHALDLAMAERENLDDFLKLLATADYRGVAPDVLVARQKLLDVLQRLYAQQTAVENQEATFTVTRTLLSAMSMMEIDLTTAAGAPPGLDAEQARTILSDLRHDQEEREDLLNGLADIENDLIDAMTTYSSTYYKWIGEWDKIVVRRDRAYLAAAAGNWRAAEDAASEAIKLAPHDTEAHVLKAWSIIETSSATAESDRIVEAMELLDGYIAKHPERSAPALLLRGVAAAKQGRFDEAALSFEQASAYYPRQSEVLTDMLDPYEARAYLRRSREGQRIVDLYRSTMLGAGAFSPDLQNARMLYATGRPDAAREKVLDHFSRRRNQNRWDLILADVEFCSTFFGPEFDTIYAEDSHLVLDVKPTLIGSKLDVGVRNSSPRRLLNATLLLALRFTDMHREDFEVFKVGETVPLVESNDTTSFGTLDVHHEFLGEEKKVDDIVLHRAIIVADDAIAWVDTDEQRLALARTTAVTESERARWFEAMKTTPAGLTRQIEKGTRLGVDLGIGADDVTLRLPKELALLNPVFRLRRDGQDAPPSTNALAEDAIELRFADVANFDAADTSGDATVVVSSRWGNFEIGLDLRTRRLTGVTYAPTP